LREQKLHVSSAALADWMERTFGPKPALPLAMSASSPTSSTDSSSPPTAGEGTKATRVVSQHRHLHLVRAAPKEGHDLPLPISVEKPRRSRRYLAAAAGLVALVALAGGALALRHGGATAAAARSEQGAANGPAVLVVAERGNVAIEGAAPVPPVAHVAPPAADQAAAPAAAPAPAAAETPPPHARRRHGSRTPHADEASGGFSATFARREAEIRRCFGEHADPAARTGEISLRFQVGRDGHVSSVALTGGAPDPTTTSPPARRAPR